MKFKLLFYFYIFYYFRKKKWFYHNNRNIFKNNISHTDIIFKNIKRNYSSYYDHTKYSKLRHILEIGIDNSIIKL